jgi:VCBS repeat-containing protein
MKIKKSVIKVAIAMAGVISLSGCFDSDDDRAPAPVIVAPDPEPVNLPPSATSVNLTTQTEVSITDQLSGSDPEGQALSFALSSEPQSGSVTIDETGSFTYQPVNEATGSDSFTYVVTDDGGLEASATVNITIEALQLSFLNYSRQAFSAQQSAKPLSLNGRVLAQDSNDQGDYQDLLDTTVVSPAGQ